MLLNSIEQNLFYEGVFLMKNQNEVICAEPICEAKEVYYLAVTTNEINVFHSAEDVVRLISSLKVGETFTGGVYEKEYALSLQRNLLAKDYADVALNSGIYLVPEMAEGPNRSQRPHKDSTVANLIRPFSLLP